MSAPLPHSVEGVRIEGHLAQGGFSEVYAATHLASGAKVVVKVARAGIAGAARTLEREGNVLETLGASCAPRLLGRGTLPTQEPYLVLEHLELPALAPGVGSFHAVATALVAAVEALHAAGFLHADLTPANVRVDPASGRVRLLDFGSAKPLLPMPSTGEGAFVGTAAYMAPEQCREHSLLTPATDIYALGVLLFELWTGRAPFQGSEPQVHEAQRSHRPPRPSALVSTPAPLEALLLKCLAKRPDERFLNAASLREALEALGPLEAPGTPSPSLGASTPTPAPAPSVVTADPTHAPARSRSERVGLLFFHSSAPASAVRSALAVVGGTLAHASGKDCVAVFPPGGADNPARLALRAAELLVLRSLCPAAVLSLGPVQVRARADGELRYTSPSFTRVENYPADLDAGVLATSEVSGLLGRPLDEQLADGRALWRVAQELAADPLTGLSPNARSPLLGRDEPLVRLLGQAFRVAEDGRPTVVTVVAEAGHGKSHFCSTVEAELGRRLPRVRLVSLRAREQLGGDGGESLRALLRALLELPRETAQLLPWLEARVGPLLASTTWTGVALTLGLISEDAPEVANLAAAPGALAGARVRAVGELLRHCCSKAPHAILLDDAQFADDGLLDALEYAALEEHRSALLVCAFGRPSFRRARASFGQRAAERLELELGPLAPDDAAALCRQLLLPAQHVPEEAVRRLTERAHGVPLLLTELVRTLKAQGLVRPGTKGSSWYLATDLVEKTAQVPVVEWLAERELACLTPALAAHARLCALLGADLGEGEHHRLLTLLEATGVGAHFPLDPRLALDELLSAGVLQRSRGGRLFFRHALVREAVAQSMPEAIAREVHRVAHHLYRDEAVGLSEQERLGRSAFHAQQAGLVREAFVDQQALARRAAQTHAYVQAELWWSRALEFFQGSGEERLEALRGRALMRYRLTRNDEALEDFRAARELAKQLSRVPDEIELLLDEATALDWSDDYRTSRQRVEEAQRLADAVAEKDAGAVPRHSLLEARLVLGQGRTAFRFSEDSRAAELLTRAAGLAGHLGDAGYETLVIALLLGGYVLATLGRLDESERAFDRVVPLTEGRGDLLHLGAALGNRSMLWTCRGRGGHVLADLRRLLDIARQLGNGRMEQQAHFYLALFNHYLHDFEKAEMHARKAVECDQRRFGEAARPESELLLARILSMQMKAAEARGVLVGLRQRQERACERGHHELDFLPAEQVLGELVERSGRPFDANAWRALRERAGGCLAPMDVVDALELEARAALGAGRSEHAVELLDRALSMAQGSALAAPRLRKLRAQAAG